jgi:predicted metalloprotease with PDZ domain
MGCVANDPNSTGWGRMVWGGTDNIAQIDTAYGLILDLTDIDHFNFTYVKADDPTTFTFQVYNSAAQGSEATISITSPNRRGFNQCSFDKGRFHFDRGAYGC